MTRAACPIPLGILLALMALSGCALFGGTAASGNERPLASPAAPANRSFQQVLTFVHRGTRRTLIAAGRICQGAVDLSLLSPQGIEVLRLHQDDNGLAAEHRRSLPREVTPRTILADFQLVHWPAAALRAAWGEAHTLREMQAERTVSHHGRLRVRVHYSDRPWRGTATLEQRIYGYRLRVETIEQHRLGSGCGDRDGT